MSISVDSDNHTCDQCGEDTVTFGDCYILDHGMLYLCVICAGACGIETKEAN